jgi:type II secretory pathway component PulK
MIVRFQNDRTQATTPRRGVVLVSVLVVVTLLTLAAYQYSEYMFGEYQAADSYSRTGQARALADSGVHYVCALLSNKDAYTNTLNSNPWDNSAYFQDILVHDDELAIRRGRFSIITLRDPIDDPQFTGQAYRFGVSDESAKLNLNALLQIAKTDPIRQQMLMQLPNMTEDIANSILDWIDSSSSIPRTNGAKDEYYPSLAPAYHVKNGPIDSLEELLLVKGVTPQLLFGNDRNRNGVLDPDEDQSAGTVDLGWQQYLTLYSREPNVSNSGTARIYLNDQNIQNLYTNLQTALGNDLAQFIVAYRLYGSSGSIGAGTTTGGTGTGTGGQGNTFVGRGGAMQQTFIRLTGASADQAYGQIQQDINNNTRAKASISSLFGLTTAQVAVPVKNGNVTTTVNLPNPLADPGQQMTLLPLLLDQTTTTKASDLTPRINVNTASSTVLSMLPNLTASDVQAILTNRPQYSSTDPIDPKFQTTAWLLTDAGLSVSTLSAMESYITARSQVYRFQVLGYFDGPGPVARVEAVVDTNNGRPRVVYFRDLSELGRGFTLPFNSGQ